MFPILNIGPLAIQTPGLLIIIGIYISILAVEKQSKRYALNANDVSNLIFLYLISTIIMGRLAYVFQFPSIFYENPLSIFSISPSLFDFTSGLILALLVAMVFIQKKKLPLQRVLDSLSLPLLIFLIFLFLALFASGNFYGKPSSLAWSITLWGTTRHPLQIYYIIGLIPVIAINIYLSKKKLIPGQLFFRTVFYVAILVVFLDFFNGNPNNLILTVNLLQIIAWLVMILLVFVNAKSKKKMDEVSNVNLNS
ncbi:MAG: prolipoprotein diacylglyceryl transferase [Anaerolineaceae bacterium]|nr:prolipoprotein diacylglyceryl transferase [Anaerolineaceae bacterium]